jgi:hypothetical protein
MTEQPTPDLPALVADVVTRSPKALISSEIAARVRRPRNDVEAALATLQTDPRLVVRDWLIEDPHFGMPRLVVAAAVDPAGGPAAVASAEQRCQRVYEDVLRDFLASHRCV